MMVFWNKKEFCTLEITMNNKEKFKVQADVNPSGDIVSDLFKGTEKSKYFRVNNEESINKSNISSIKLLNYD